MPRVQPLRPVTRHQIRALEQREQGGDLSNVVLVVRVGRQYHHVPRGIEAATQGGSVADRCGFDERPHTLVLARPLAEHGRRPPLGADRMGAHDLHLGDQSQVDPIAQTAVDLHRRSQSGQPGPQNQNIMFDNVRHCPIF